MRSWGIYSLFACIAFTGVSYANGVLSNYGCKLDENTEVFNATANATDLAVCLLDEFFGLDRNNTEEFQNESVVEDEGGSSVEKMETPLSDLPVDMRAYVFHAELIKHEADFVCRVNFSGQGNVIFESNIVINLDGQFVLPSGAFSEEVALQTLNEGLMFKYIRGEEMLILSLFLSGDIEILVNTIEGDIHFENEGLLCVHNDLQYVQGQCSMEEGKMVCPSCSLLLRDGKKTIQAKQRQVKREQLKQMFDPAAIAGE